jgi:hypothetical protein
MRNFEEKQNYIEDLLNQQKAVNPEQFCVNHTWKIKFNEEFS